MKQILLNLAETTMDDFTQDIARRIPVGKRSKKVQDLKNFVLVLPEMVEQIRSWLDRAKGNQALRNLHGFMMTYLYHPEDFVPETGRGLFGYLDDAYLVGNIYYRAMLNLGAGQKLYLPGQESLARRIRPWLRLTRRVLPAETERIDSMLDDLRRTNLDSFQEMMGATRSSK
jgi:uncharacterized membrane protein YkvA (DUF1232 family)